MGLCWAPGPPTVTQMRNAPTDKTSYKRDSRCVLQQEIMHPECGQNGMSGATIWFQVDDDLGCSAIGRERWTPDFWDNQSGHSREVKEGLK